jgi:hypothetical protein
VIGLEAAGRSAVDIKGKIKRAPAKTAALAAGTAFLALKGPQRVYRGARRAFLGPRANLPKSMLPKEIDKAVRALGDDGAQVRGVLEREFASYLEKGRPEREARNLKGTLAELGGNILRPVTAEAGKRMAKGLFSPDSGFDATADRIRARFAGRESEPEGETATPPPETSGGGSRWVRRPGLRRNKLRPR